MIGILGVGAGGILGTLLRYYLGKWISGKMGGGFPYGTWAINLSGSFLLGLLSALHSRHGIPEWSWLMFGVGFCGAYTTFSTFGYETIGLIEQGRKRNAAVYVISSVLLGVLFAWLGNMCVR
ncbi:fluoride efflux transporter CrcB [Paenibacillus macerans]|uniref:Fluoride-specific ion channel FluC n=1 Tax=Paenibacillus macerans TaxID=44252 RepID=A0A090ZEQ6_PAEMA|nr:fluoride efflux transporter CrcB [Paenibacillus macerans]KFN09082.1 crcB-like family protein [Paenibacillus macerans]MCY7560786.1 fluoride efflux transporter CrcB [Paenibacillus macerans]MEC0151840.1 fluoride efflux transporter CrcB [Paenibacillus macerans]SUA82973.1 crcb [Paenibacillus macerans]